MELKSENACLTLSNHDYCSLNEHMKVFSNAIFDTLRQRLDQHLAVDLRSLALVSNRAWVDPAGGFDDSFQDVESLYSGSGVLPLGALAQLPHLTWEWWLSVNVISDSVVWQQACFVTGMVCAVLLTIGWKTRWVAPFMLVHVAFHSGTESLG
jgi:hypothetical protein